MILTGFETNLFKGGKLYQFDKEYLTIAISETKKYTRDFCLNGKDLDLLNNISKNLEDLELLNNNKVRCKNRSASYTTSEMLMPDYDIEDAMFEGFKPLYNGKKLVINVADLEKAATCVDTNNSRSFYRGVIINSNEFGDLEIVATDSFRFFRTQNHAAPKENNGKSIPISFVNQISSLSKKFGFNEIKVEFNDRFIKCDIFTADNFVTLYSRLYSGQMANFSELELLKNPYGIDAITFTASNDLKIGKGLVDVLAENNIIKFTFKSSFNEYEVTYPCKCENRFEGKFDAEYFKSMVKYEEENEMIIGNIMIKLNGFILLKMRGL